MYPNLYHFLKEVFHIDPWGFTKYINSFGTLVAISFLLAAWLLTRELKRKETAGLLKPVDEIFELGKSATKAELLTNAVFGFIIGYKLIGVLFNTDALSPQEYIFSLKGSWGGGFFMAVVFAGLRFFEKHRVRLPKPQKKTIQVWPHERVGDITMIAAIGGFLGAKIFDNLENWDRFIQDPIRNLFSPSGLTFYGGLICATVAIFWYARKKNIHWLHLCDAAAPGLMLAYAVGRLGCQISGDGDWGIFNSAYTLDSEGNIIPGTIAQFNAALQTTNDYTQHLVNEFGSLGEIPHAHVSAPSFLPDWLFAYHYPHNVNEVGTFIPDCVGNYCTQLNPLVFPTPLYEFIICSLLFIFLWVGRTKFKFPGQLFAVYLIFNGIERFFIEKIRVNSTYSILGFHPSQAELISTLLITGGVILWYRSGKNKIPGPKTS